MKFNYGLFATLVLVFGAANAHAFAPTFDFETGIMKVTANCPDLGLVQNDTALIIAEYTQFSLEKWPSSAGQPQVLISFSAPVDGSYVFNGPAGLQYTREFLTNAFDGSDNYDFKSNGSTGNITITHVKPDSSKTTCTLAPIPFGG